MQVISRKEAKLLGLKRYFTGKPCKHGHISERYTLKSSCIGCLSISSLDSVEYRREYNKKRYHSMSDEKIKMERDRLRIHNSIEYKKNPEKFRARSIDYRNKNIEKSTERCNKWRVDNRDSLLEKRRVQYSLNPDKYRKNRTDYYSKNKEIEKSRQSAFRSKNSVFFGKLNKERFDSIKAATPKWANKKLINDMYLNRKRGMHVDHIIPLKSKLVCGLHCEANLQYLGAVENIRKGNRYWPDMP